MREIPMKYSKVGFRKVYKKFCLFDMNDTFRKAMPDILEN